MTYRASKFVADATGALPALRLDAGYKGWTVTLHGPGTPTATVLVEVSNDGVYWSTFYTFTITSAGSVNHTAETHFLFHRFSVTALAAGARALLSVV